jgi:hypothetical protein
MTKCLLISCLLGETVPLVFLLVGRYFETLSSLAALNRIEIVLWPASFLGIMTGGGDEAADDQIRAVSILLNAAFYTALGLLLWLTVLRRRS